MELSRETIGTIHSHLNSIISHAEINSEDFMELYDAIYSYCTTPTTEYIILGEKIYEILRASVDRFFQHLLIQPTLKDFNLCCDRLERTITISEASFSYITRYFIRASRDREDPGIYEIQTLFFISFYRNKLNYLIDEILQSVLTSLDYIRNTGKGNDGVLKITLKRVRKVLLANNELARYHKFLDQVINNFKTHLRPDLCTNLKFIMREVTIVNKVFDAFSSLIIQRNLFNLLVGKEARILGVFKKELESGKKVSHIYTICKKLHVGGRAISIFIKFVKGLLTETTDLNGVVAAYMQFSNLVNSKLGEDPGLQEAVRELFALFIQPYVSELVSEIFAMMELQDEVSKGKQFAIMEFIQLIEDKALFYASLYRKIYVILIEDENECAVQSLLAKIDPFIERECLSRINRLLNEYRKGKAEIICNGLFASECGSFYQKVFSKCEVQGFLLSKPFWKLNCIAVKVDAEPSRVIENIFCAILKNHGSRKFFPSYLNTKVILRIDGHRISLNSFEASLVLYIGELSRSMADIATAFGVDAVKSMVRLQDEGVVELIGEMLEVSNSIKEDKNLFRLSFEEVDAKTDEETTEQQQVYRREAEIMKILKKTPLMQKNELLELLDYEIAKVDNVLAGLAEKDFIILEGSAIHYVP